MVVKLLGGTLRGLQGEAVSVEIVQRPGRKTFTYVGLPTAAVRESKDRILGAIRSSALPEPRGSLLVSLAPADLKKEGGGLDLAIALGVLAAGGVVPGERLQGLLVAGELALSGEVRAIRGSLALGLLAQGRGDVEGLVLPAGNLAAVRRYLEVPLYPVRTLIEAVRLIGLGEVPEVGPGEADDGRHDPPAPVADLAEVRGQEEGKRALIVAAAGGHSLLLVGPPGTGKSLLARRLPGLLPPLDRRQSLETALVYSATGRDRRHRALAPPFRAPHHTVSHVGLVGGSNPPRPGEVSLAHNGILFLDELPEFRRSALEALRECLEEGAVSVVRAGASERFPARFQLVAAMNPCPCGFATHPGRCCTCSAGEAARYRKRLSGAFLDRVDLEVHAGPVYPEDLEGARSGPASAEARALVAGARGRQAARNPGEPPRLNAHLGPDEIMALAGLEPGAAELLRASARKLQLSARAYHRTLRVARTIADLAGKARIEEAAVAEALRYRAR